MGTDHEIVFKADCQVCGRKDADCRNHHLIPRRLLATLPFNRQKQWKHLQVRICSSCNSYIHPENKLYKKIIILKKQLGYKLSEEEQEVEKSDESNIIPPTKVGGF